LLDEGTGYNDIVRELGDYNIQEINAALTHDYYRGRRKKGAVRKKLESGRE
jgi:hypothetical protein